ncbi:MAG: DUF3501 family protein [Alphaproteobacteria bacterium]|jgi:hypothetical protein|nr:DUF3501 family protein [Alphaproteobacteria bacterium]
MSQPHEISRADIMEMDAYGTIRDTKRRELRPMKDRRRVPVGPYATFFFESYETMWHQIHEMLFVERGGEAQIADELEAYNPLVPKGDELVATVMFEIDDPVRRKAVLGSLGGVEETMSLEFAGEVVPSDPETDVDRTTAEGKASSVQFVHFRMSPAQAAKFKEPGTRVVLAINHPDYSHMAVLSEQSRVELARDLA